MHSRKLATCILSICLCGLIGARVAWAQKTAEKPKAYESKVVKQTTKKPKSAEKKKHFIRVTRDKKGTPLSLQTAIVSYEKGKGDNKVTVYLVGAVHIGDRAYYRQLNREFEKYDVVLYELVAPKGTRIERGSRSTSTFNTLARKLLKLDTQVARIDYTKKNFVHADMSAKDMKEAMKNRGDDPLSVALRVASDMMRQQNKRMNGKGKPIPRISLFTLLADPKRHLKLKRIMAEEFASEETSSGLGETLNVMLIDDRNKVAMQVFDKELKKKKYKSIAIFYGAAHLPDFDKRLRKNYGFKQKKIEWFTAWDLED